tara:strand:+ start:4030 stop:4623 length:594 start_codon:yes stop_codon:yes gene_type:complete
MVIAVDKWLNRVGASSVTDNTEDFITLAQRRIQRDVRVPPMEVLSSGITITAGQSAIPSAMLDVKEIVAYNGSTAWPVYRDTYANVKNKRLGTGSGPVVFDTVAGNFEFGPEPTSGVTVDIVYYQELEFISPSVASNWFSLYAPELVLYAALYEAAVFMKDTEQEQKYKQMYSDARELLKAQKEKAEWSGRLQVTAG